jgi:hypothetical protein
LRTSDLFCFVVRSSRLHINTKCKYKYIFPEVQLYVHKFQFESSLYPQGSILMLYCYIPLSLKWALPMNLFNQNVLSIYCFSKVCYMSRPPNPPWFNYLITIYVKITNCVVPHYLNCSTLVCCLSELQGPRKDEREPTVLATGLKTLTGRSNVYTNKIGDVYSVEHTDIPKVFFSPHHEGHCCTNAIRDHCCTVIWVYCCPAVCSNNET